MKTTFDKLKDRIYKDTDVELVNFRRIYRGKHSKSSTFAWTAHTKEKIPFGSMITATELLNKKEKIEILYTNIGLNEFL